MVLSARSDRCALLAKRPLVVNETGVVRRPNVGRCSSPHCRRSLGGQIVERFPTVERDLHTVPATHILQRRQHCSQGTTTGYFIRELRSFVMSSVSPVDDNMPALDAQLSITDNTHNMHSKRMSDLECAPDSLSHNKRASPTLQRTRTTGERQVDAAYGFTGDII